MLSIEIVNVKFHLGYNREILHYLHGSGALMSPKIFQACSSTRFIRMTGHALGSRLNHFGDSCRC